MEARTSQPNLAIGEVAIQVKTLSSAQENNHACLLTIPMTHAVLDTKEFFVESVSIAGPKLIHLHASNVQVKSETSFK